MRSAGRPYGPTAPPAPGLGCRRDTNRGPRRPGTRRLVPGTVRHNRIRRSARALSVRSVRVIAGTRRPYWIDPERIEMANKGILGRKLGMTQVFDDANHIIPVTVSQAGPC